MKIKKILISIAVAMTLVFTSAAHGHHHHHHHGYVAPIAFGLGMLAGRTFMPPPTTVVVVPPPHPIRVWVGGYWLPNGVYVPGHWEYR